MPRKNVDLEIIVLTYDSEFWLKKTLSSLKSNYIDKSKYQVAVTVVDNHSSDQTVPMMNRDFKWVKLITLEENLGFAAGNNRGLKESRGRYVMLLNSDVEFNPDSNLDELLDFLEQNPTAGAISPKVIFTTGQLDPACHRGEPTPWTSFCYFTGLAALFPKSRFFANYHQTYKLLDTIHTIDACTGAAMIVRQSAIDKIGLLDERFFIYAEDLDWCRRLREAGYSIIFYPHIKVIHHKYKSGIKGTSKQIARQTERHFYDTMLQYYDKYYRDSYPELVRSIIRYFIIIKKGAT